MPRTLTACLFGFLVLSGAGAQGLTDPAVSWVLLGPESVTPGEPFTVQAQVRLPAGFYQDAASSFLQWEPRFAATVTERTHDEAGVRSGKASFTGTFTLYRTLVLPVGTPSGPRDLVFTVGWQICQVSGVCLLPVEQTRTLKITVARPRGTEFAAILSAVFGAFVGGLFLNLMPCVFPVLALKALGLASSAGRTRTQRRREALAFAAGGFFAVTFLGGMTAIMAAWGQRLDWGFPFQQPVFVGALSVAFGALSLPLLGIGKGWSPFSLTQPIRGGLLAKAGSGAFLLLAAAPCTAPLLGPALGFALARPALEIPFYFMAIGFGLVLPLLVLQTFPDWGRFLPKPGRWLTVTERVAGILLAATTVYLAWVFVSLAGTPGLPSLVGLGAAGLLTGGAAFVGHQGTRRALQGSALVLVLGTLTILAVLPLAPEKAPTPPAGWVSFTPEGLDQARAQGPVLVDATAAWCATCQVNELAVLLRPDVTNLLNSWGVIRIRADYTRPDPAIQKWLAGVGRAGLPVYALYRPGRTVYLFPELLTDENFTQALPGLLAP